MTDLLVVGAGLAGLYAAVLASRRGARVRVIAEGRGGLALSHGCIDARRDGAGPHDAGWPTDMDASRMRLGAALAELCDVLAQQGLPYTVSLSQPIRLPTALGATHAVWAAPVMMADGDLDRTEPIHLADIAGVRDFSAPIVEAGLHTRGIATAGVASLELPAAISARPQDPLSLARAFDSTSSRAEILSAWSAQLSHVRRLGLPAVLGFEQALSVFTEASERLGVVLFEIPTLPPSLPGLRLEHALRRHLAHDGVEVIEGPPVRGEVDGRSGGRRVSGVLATTSGGPRLFRAETILLATGGALHGGWMGFPNGEVQDSVFGLPITAPDDRDRWTAESPFDIQPFATFGLRVDSLGRPCHPEGSPYFENLFAAGGILAGHDRATEGSRQALDLLSAYVAVQGLLASVRS